MFKFLIDRKLPMLMWFSVTLFFAFQFIMRLSQKILMNEIMIKHGVDTAAFGTMAGLYYVSYSLMQIPLGVMLDKFNFRYVTAGSILLATFGNIMFTFAASWEYVLLGRLCVGAGSAVGFLAVVKVIKTFFEPEYHGNMIGLSFTFGLIGAVFGSKPMKILVNAFGSHNVVIILSLVALLIAILVIFVAKSDDSSSNEDSNVGMNDIINVLINPKILLIGFSGGLMVGSLEGFADLWSGPFFSQIYGFSEVESNGISAFIFIGMCFGGPILAFFSRYFSSVANLIAITSAFMTSIFIKLMTNTSWVSWHLEILMFVLGILCCYQVLVFTMTSKLVEKNLTGVAIAVVNCINMSFGYFFHEVIGTMMQKYWSGILSNEGVRIYSYDVFVKGLAIIPIASFIGMLGFLLLGFISNRQEIRGIKSE